MSVALSMAILGLLAILLYAWLGYPLLLAAAARLFRRPWRVPAGGGVPVRSLAVLFSAHNEERHIAARLRNLLAECAPLLADGVDCRLLVGADGCSDGTAAIAAAWAREHPIVSVRQAPQQGGKVRMLKALATETTAEVLVFTDANTEFAPGALAALLAPLSDPTVGAVCGRLVLTPGRPGAEAAAGREGGATAGVQPEGTYWRWETKLKEWESALDSCLGANGAIYALRRELFWRDVPDNTVVDDLVLGMKVREAGRRVLYEPRAVASEELPDVEHEWRRRVRIGAGDFQALSLCRRCLRPSYGWFAWAFFSHKLLRWFTPHLAVASVALAVAVAMREWRAARVAWPGSFALALAVLAAAAAAVGMALSGRRLRGRGAVGRMGRVLRFADHTLTMQAALFAGWLRYCRGGLQGHWTRTPRA